MLLLTTTGSKLDLVTDTADETQVFVSFVDFTASATTPGEWMETITSATATDIVPAPASSTQRQVKFLSIYNNGTGNQTVTVRSDDGSDKRRIYSALLSPQDAVHYVDGQGFYVVGGDGRRKERTTTLGLEYGVLANPFFASANLTATKTMTSGTAFAVYVGKAPRATSAVNVMFRVTQAAATITWAEVGVATGRVVFGGSPTLTMRGFANVATVVNSLGVKNVAVTVSAGQTINEGNDLWFVFSTSATTANILRAQSIADDLQVGLQASRAATQPSTTIGSAQAYTVEGATTLAAWAAMFVG